MGDQRDLRVGCETWMDLRVDWTPGIGDPTWMGWLTVFAYFPTALLGGATAGTMHDIPSAERGRNRAVWVTMTLLLVALGVNKQLDPQSRFTAFGRAVFTNHGSLPDRRMGRFVAASSKSALFGGRTSLSCGRLSEVAR